MFYYPTKVILQQHLILKKNYYKRLENYRDG